MYIISVLRWYLFFASIHFQSFVYIYLFFSHKHQTVAFFILSDNLCRLNSPLSLLTFNIITVDIHGANLATYFILSFCLTYSVYFSFSLFSWNWLCASMYLNHFVLFFVTWDSFILFLSFSAYPRNVNCSQEIKRCLLLGRKVMTNLESILKSRFITVPTKVDIVKAMVFPVVMYECESWGIKKAEHWRIDAFELWCWRRLLRVPWTMRRSNQSILKEISPEYSLEGLMLKLKLQSFGHLM